MIRPVPNPTVRIAAIVSVAILLGAAAAIYAAPANPSAQGDLAKQILDATGLQGGMIVHLGCGDGKLTAALHASDSYLVHGLDTDVAKVAEARQYLQSLGVCGPASVDRFDGKHLPYADNMVNLLVAENLGSVATEEAMRVLAPGGMVYTKQDGRWTKTVKPRPKNIDEWSHFLHDASGNPVAHDDVVAPPGSLQWTEEPRFTRSHEHLPGVVSLVSTHGRIFYLLDEAPTASIRRPGIWKLVARDAFNGVLLWEKPIETWYPHLVGWTSSPPQLQRKLISVGDRVYVTLGLHDPLSEVDAATGKVLKVYENTAGTEEILWHQRTLLLVIRSVTEEKTAQLAKFAQLIRRGESPLDKRDTAEPLVRRLRNAEMQGDLSVVALDPASGRVLWSKTGEDVSNLKGLSLCADGDHVFYQNGQNVVCLDLATGQERWSRKTSPLRLVASGNVVCADNTEASILSAQTGEPIWQQPHKLTEVRDAFIAGGSLWVGGFKPAPGKRSPAWGPYFVTQLDLASGELLKHVEPENPSHHHRCYQNKATDRYILGGRRGTEFIDLASGEVLWNSWARGVCRYGVMPCNGLLYAPPHECACYMAAKLVGFNALAPRRPLGQTAESELPSLERGPAYDALAASGSSRSDDWPTYRHDAERSGVTASSMPARLQVVWQTEVGPRLTAPTVADGKVLAASVNDHRVCALDAASGKPAWQFTAGARVDSPPTLYQGRAIFGCRDGYVYSLRAADGALAWRQRAAREDRRAVVCGQLESVSPVEGSVLFQDGVAYVTAGRSTYLDGGIDLCRLEPATGKIVSRTPVYSPDPATGKQPAQYGPAAMPGQREDILSADSGYVYLRDIVFDKLGRPQEQGAAHLFAMTGFLDDAWVHRSYLIFGTQCSVAGGCSSRDKNLIYGRLLAFDQATIYGYGRATVHWSNALEDGPYRLFARGKADERPRWETPLPIQVRALLVAGGTIFAAGPRVGTSVGPWDRGEDQRALVLAVSALDGKPLGETQLDGTPVFDGMAAAGGRLYVSLENGRVACLAASSL